MAKSPISEKDKATLDEAGEVLTQMFIHTVAELRAKEYNRTHLLPVPEDFFVNEVTAESLEWMSVFIAAIAHSSDSVILTLLGMHAASECPI